MSGETTASLWPHGVVTVVDGVDALNVGAESPVLVELADGQRVTTRRHLLNHLRRPGYHRAARTAAFLAMSRLGGRMLPNSGPALRRTDPVAYWDTRASMDDQRAALCLAVGLPVEHISRQGYDVSVRSGR